MRRIVSSMFARRALLLLGGVWAAMGVLAAQSVRLTLVDGAAHAREAESKLVRRSWTPTLRGRILDRKGRVLAEDRPSFNVEVDYRVLSGEWARVQAAILARKAAGARWSELDSVQREGVARAIEPVLAAHVERMRDELARAAGMDRARLDARWEAILTEVERLRASVMLRRWDAEARARLDRGAELSEEASRDIHRRIARPITEETSRHVLIPRVTDEGGFALLRREGAVVAVEAPSTAWSPAATLEVPALPGVRVVNAGDRAYPFDRRVVEIDTSSFPASLRREGTARIEVSGVAIHVLGWTRVGVTREDVDRRRAAVERDESLRGIVERERGVDRGAYQAGDVVGVAGVEAGMEPRLRGLRGLTTEHLEDGTSASIEAEAGRDVRLSIDVELQARVQALMDPSLGLAAVQAWHASDNPTMPVGTPIHGSAVVLDVDSGEILALVSTPTFTREELAASSERIFGDRVAVPYLNKAIARPYPPGSIAKALVLCEATARGVVGAGTRISCDGHLLPNRPDLYRCWVFKRPDINTTHAIQFGGPIDPVQGLMVSCNVFFFTLGQRLGPEGIVSAYRRFGVGERWGLGVGTEYAGGLGLKGDGAGLTIQDAIQMGIGQGPVDWTPLHAADAYATIARGGLRVGPTLRAGEALAKEPVEGVEAGARLAMEGLSAAVNERRGTGHHITHEGRQEPNFNVPGIKVWGKTGTADAPKVVEDPDGGGPEAARVLREGDHSWFVVLVGREEEGRPRYAIAVMMEHAGSGGKVSGPIANQIIRALVDEGYL